MVSGGRARNPAHVARLPSLSQSSPNQMTPIAHDRVASGCSQTTPNLSCSRRVRAHRRCYDQLRVALTRAVPELGFEFVEGPVREVVFAHGLIVGAGHAARTVEIGYTATAARRSWTKLTTIAPSPTAVAHRFTDPERTSPAT
jgi:hypothetical protein